MRNIRNSKIKSTVFFLTVFLFSMFLVIDGYQECLSKPKSHSKKTTKSITKKKSSSKKSAASKTSKSKKSKRAAIKVKSKKAKYSKPVYEVVYDTLLSPGVNYKIIHTGRVNAYQKVHVLEADLINSEIKPEILKAKNQASELEKLQDMARQYDSTQNSTVLGAVNGNFWRAYSNTPIGPTIINGEVIELKTHKQWSSGFFDEDDHLWIDNFFLSAAVELADGRKLNIQNVNRRLDSNGVILYNKYGGDTIPFIRKKFIEEEILRKIRETVELQKQDTLQLNDSTESEFDTLKLKQELITATRTAMLENSLKKISLFYLDEPAVNRDIRCIVASIDTAPAAVPKNGCIISFGTDTQKNLLPKKNDTLIINFSTNVHSNIPFFKSISGTPRLVRNGLAKHEAYQEGSKGRRFISKPLPRTAIGTDRFKRKLYFVTVEGNGKEGKHGANLQQLAVIMRQVGCYNAMNLDGGGSTIMIVNNKNVIYRSNPESSRKLSVGVAIVLENPPINKFIRNNN